MSASTTIAPVPTRERLDATGPTARRLPGPATTRIFRREPDLLAGLDDDLAEVLRQRVSVRTLGLGDGEWLPEAGQGDGALGLLVLDGLLVRNVELGGRGAPELIGSGDLLRPWDEAGEAGCLCDRTSWRVLSGTQIAVLGPGFASVVARFPSILAALLSRSLRRARTLAVQLAVSTVRQADRRLLMLLWHLADRWGRMTPGGVLLPLPLTHALLARLAGLRRPTTSTTLQQLTRAGELARRPDGGWLLTGSAQRHALAA